MVVSGGGGAGFPMTGDFSPLMMLAALVAIALVVWLLKTVFEF